MTDTIDLLETIGRDASLRRAPAEEMARRLERANGSSVLVAAAAAGDRSLLAAEFGAQSNQSPQVTQMPAREEEGPEEQEPLEAPVPAPKS